MKKKIYIFFKLITFFIAIYLFINFINQEEFLDTIRRLDLFKIIIIFFTFIPLPFLMTVRWYLIVNNFSKIPFIDFFRNIITGFSVSLISSSSLALDVTKLIKIKPELGTEQSLLLVIIDKFFALIFKIFFLVCLINFLNIFYLKINVSIFTSISIFFLLTIFVFIYKFKFICNYLHNKNIFNYNLKKLINIFLLLKPKFKLILMMNFIIQSLNIFLYFMIFKFLETDFNLLKLAIFIPLVELVSQFQFLIFGLKELSTVFLFSFLNFTYEQSLAGALIYTFTDFLAVICLYFMFNLIYLPKNK